jgi:hypothetical protein
VQYNTGIVSRYSVEKRSQDGRERPIRELTSIVFLIRLECQRAHTADRCTMFERREITRTKIVKVAQIALDQCPLVFQCNVHNITDAGACLELYDAPALPQLLDLSFDSFRTRRRCRVLWRNDTRAGVTFQS